MAALPDFGSCWSCLDDLTMPSIMASGFRVVGEAVARRWNTPRGGLVDDPDYGFDLTDYVGDDIGPTDIARISHMAGAEAEKDERVLSADVTVSLLSSGVLTVSGVITTAAGPFQLVVAVTGVSVTLLQASGASQ
jgi:hypothetical protein